MYTEDWFMRQIEMMIAFIVKIILGKNNPNYEIDDEMNLNDADLLHIKLVALLENYKINEAEDLLFADINTEDNKYLEVAADFYSRLNSMSNDEIENNNFSREEIDSGFKEIKQKFNIII